MCVQIATLMFQSYRPIAHTQHSGHTEQSEKSSDADGHAHHEPAWTDLTKKIMF